MQLLVRTLFLQLLRWAKAAARMVYRIVSKNRAQLSHPDMQEWLMTACPSNWKKHAIFFLLWKPCICIHPVQSFTALLSLHRRRHQQGTRLLTAYLTPADSLAIDDKMNKNITDAMLKSHCPFRCTHSGDLLWASATFPRDTSFIWCIHFMVSRCLRHLCRRLFSHWSVLWQTRMQNVSAQSTNSRLQSMAIWLGARTTSLSRYKENLLSYVCHVDVWSG